QPYLNYVSDVLPSLGEESVQAHTLRDLVPEGATAVPEPDPAVARLKSAAAMVDAIETAVRLYEEPPTEELVVETPWADLRLSPSDWAECCAAPDPGTPHNDARSMVRDAAVEILLDSYAADEVGPDRLRTVLERHPSLDDALGGAWPLLDAPTLVG